MAVIHESCGRLTRRRVNVLSQLSNLDYCLEGTVDQILDDESVQSLVAESGDRERPWFG